MDRSNPTIIQSKNKFILTFLLLSISRYLENKRMFKMFRKCLIIFLCPYLKLLLIHHPIQVCIKFYLLLLDLMLLMMKLVIMKLQALKSLKSFLHNGISKKILISAIGSIISGQIFMPLTTSENSEVSILLLSDLMSVKLQLLNTLWVLISWLMESVEEVVLESLLCSNICFI